MSAFNTQTPGKYPEDNLSLLQHGESLKTRNTLNLFIYSMYPNRRKEYFADLLYEKCGVTTLLCTKLNVFCLDFFHEN